MTVNPEIRANRRAMLQMVLCAALWSIAGIFMKLIPWNPFALAGSRSFIASFVLLAYIRKRGFKLRLNGRSISIAAVTSATFIMFVSANKLTTAANAIALQYTEPVFLLIISALFFKQRFRFGDILAVILTLAGIALFFFDKLDSGKLLGNLLAVGAGLNMSLMFLLTGRATEDDRMSGMYFGHMLTALIGIPFMLFTETPFTTTAVLSILVLGIVQLGIPYVLFGMASRRCPPLTCSLISFIEPILNPVWVFLFNGEAPGTFAILGGVAVIVTVAVWCVWRDRNEKRTAELNKTPA